MLGVAAFSLTSCQVNLGEAHFTVPWWAIVIPSILIVVIAWFAAAKHVASQKYVCPECGKSFYPKWWNAAFSVQMNDDHALKCPHCGRKGFCPPSRETKD